MDFLATNVAWVVTGILLVGIGLAITQYFRFKKSGKAPTAGLMVPILTSFIVGVLLTPFITNLYSLNREKHQRELDKVEAQRQRDLDARVRHLDVLRPVLRNDATMLTELSNSVEEWGRYTKSNALSPEKEEDSLWDHDRLLTDDFSKHFFDFSKARQDLRHRTSVQGDAVREFVGTVHGQLQLTETQPVSAIALVRECMGKGPGLQIKKTDSSYYFNNGLNTKSTPDFLKEAPNSLPPPVHVVAALDAYHKFPRTPAFKNKCAALAVAANELIIDARRLSDEAEVLAVLHIDALQGSCVHLTGEPAK